MASSSRGASCTKPLKGVFSTHPSIQVRVFVTALSIFAQVFNFGLNKPLPYIRKSLRECNF